MHVYDLYSYIYIYTLPKTNIAPKNDDFQEESSFPGIYFQGIY